MRIYLAEGSTGAFPFIVDRACPFVTESRKDGSVVGTRIRGRLSICDCVNGNNRRYSRKVWEKNMVTGSPLQEAIKRNAAFGTLEHPADGQVTLASPISHMVTEAKLLADGTVDGEIMLLSTSEGNKLRALIEAGYNPPVSSRGYGTVQTTEGVDEVLDDYVCEGWDVVIKPSFEQAELQPERSSTISKLAEPVLVQPVVTEAAKEQPKPAVTLTVSSALSESMPQWMKESWESVSSAMYHRALAMAKTLYPDRDTGKLTSDEWTKINAALQKDREHRHAEVFNRQPVATAESKTSPESISNKNESTSETAAPAAKPNTSKTMEINEIRRRVTECKSLDTTKLTPERFAEGIALMETLHQEIANYAAEDAKRSYEAIRLHNALEETQKVWSTTASAPTRKAQKLGESNIKLMKIISATAKAGNAIKTKLGESLKANRKLTALVEDLTRRGKGWVKVAESRKIKLSAGTKENDTLCESLSLIADRYHQDVTELARRVIVLEFKEKAAVPAIQEQLKKATRLRHIVAVRETLEGKKPAKPITEAKTGVKAVLDIKPEPKTEPVKPVITESARVVYTTPEDPRGINESIALTQRLSASVR